MLVITTAKGYFGSLIEAGQTFEVPVGVKGSWFKPVGKDEGGQAALGSKAGKSATTTTNVDTIAKATK